MDFLVLQQIEEHQEAQSARRRTYTAPISSNTQGLSSDTIQTIEAGAKMLSAVYAAVKRQSPSEVVEAMVGGGTAARQVSEAGSIWNPQALNKTENKSTFRALMQFWKKGKSSQEAQNEILLKQDHQLNVNSSALSVVNQNPIQEIEVMQQCWNHDGSFESVTVQEEAEDQTEIMSASIAELMETLTKFSVQFSQADSQQKMSSSRDVALVNSSSYFNQLLAKMIKSPECVKQELILLKVQELKRDLTEYIGLKNRSQLNVEIKVTKKRIIQVPVAPPPPPVDATSDVSLQGSSTLKHPTATPPLRMRTLTNDFQDLLSKRMVDGKPMLKPTPIKRSPNGTPIRRQSVRTHNNDLFEGLRKKFLGMMQEE